jgi:two-component system, chemotaxis family, CheB/CheR fusion protein
MMRKRSGSRSDSIAAFAVVGVGASAGGFEAFCELLEALPPHPHLAIVLVQHLAPQYASALPALLAGHSKLPVVQVTEGVQLQPDHVYIVPPNAQMEAVDGHLHLTPRPDDRSQYTPIDFFFRSLAKTLRERAIGVILSGTASDGSVGIREIKAMGGITLAQDPATAKHDGMPTAAIATQMIDLVLPPKGLAGKLVEIADHPLLLPHVPAPKAVQPDAIITNAHLDKVFELLLPETGVNFAHYKSPTIVRRLLRRMALLRMSDVHAYIRFLEDRPDEVVNLHNDFLIHVTRFFREPESLDVLTTSVLPAIAKDGRDDEPIRAWVAGCATGEEAYSLAILMLESLGARIGDRRIQIFGTDVSEAAITFARRAVYPAAISADVSPERLRKYFIGVDGGYRVTKLLRELCVFARQDLTRDPPFSRLDLICCRNVLIYLDAARQQKLLSVFHYALKATGALLLGHAETIGFHSELFAVIHKKQRIYRKKSGLGPAAPDFVAAVPRVQTAAPSKIAEPAHGNTRVVLGEANRLVLDRYAPPSVLVDQNFRVVQFNGQTGPYLEPSPGEPSFQLLKLAREGLLHGLRTALQSAKKTRRAARKQGLHVRDGAVWHDVDVEVIPIAQSGETFYLVLFESKPADAGRDGARRQRTRQRTAANRAGTQSHRLSKLEEELAATREYLQSTIQELEAANEELQSANEEILSSNEELQSTNEELDTAKEELQSTNEELNTVNDELRTRNDDLTDANADLLNLLGSVQIALVIVSADLRVRRFTPIAEKLFNLIPGDIGRPLAQLSPNIDLPDLHSLIAETINHVAPIERRVQDKQGRSYLLRLRPYKSGDSRIDGAVIALFDLDAAAQ